MVLAGEDLLYHQQDEEEQDGDENSYVLAENENNNDSNNNILNNDKNSNNNNLGDDNKNANNNDIKGSDEDEKTKNAVDTVGKCVDHTKKSPSALVKTLEFNLKCKFVNTTAIEIIWDEPSIANTNNFCGYVITWAPITTKHDIESHTYVELDPNKTCHLVTDLDYNLPYWFLVKMFLNDGMLVKESADFNIAPRWFEHDRVLLPHDPPIHSLTTFSVVIISFVTIAVVIIGVLGIIKCLMDKYGTPYIFNRSMSRPSSRSLSRQTFKIGQSLQSIFKKRGRDDNVNFSTLVDQSERELTRV